MEINLIPKEELFSLIETFEYSWSAEIKLKNNQVLTIWYTCFPSIKDIISEIIWIASDIPKHKFK